jgi:glycosyltransferase involved in cell wall biosynthesis
VRILLISNMYPGPKRPEFGVFVQNLAEELKRRGHDVDEAVLRDSRSGRLRTPLKYLNLLIAASTAARHARPDVIYAHFLVPTGAIARLVSRQCAAPYVVTAHGQDVANARRNRLMSAVTRWAVARAAGVICVSDYLARRLPEAGTTPVNVIDCGVDTARFKPAERLPGAGPRFLFVGSLTPRKNVGRLVQAHTLLGRGSLTVVGSGPLEAGLRAGAPATVCFVGSLTQDGVAEQLRRADVLCLPSLEEPFGQAALEALATGRPVVATRVGGPPEYVTPECGSLIDPFDPAAIAEGMRHAATLPVPCAEATRVAQAHDLSVQAARVEAVLLQAAAGAARSPRPSGRAGEPPTPSRVTRRPSRSGHRRQPP